MNLVQIAGHLGADAETRFTPSGQKVTNLRVATNSRRGNKDETIWWRVTIWGDRFDKLLPYLKKGSSVIIVGELSKPEVYTDKDGNPQVTLTLTAEIIRFSPFGKGERQGGEQTAYGQGEQNLSENNHGAFSQENQHAYSHIAQSMGFAGYGQGQQVTPGNGGPMGKNAHAASYENDEVPF